MGTIDESLGGIIAGWLIKVVIGVLLVGLACMEAGSVIQARVAVDELATTTAQELAASRPRAERQAWAFAAAYVQEQGGELVDLRLESGLVHVRVRKRARTLMLHRVDSLRDKLVVSAEGTAARLQR